MEWHRLHPLELNEFYQMHGQPEVAPEVLFEHIKAKGGSFTKPVIDLYIASQLRGQLSSTQIYTLEQLKNLTLLQVQQFATIFGLNPSDPDVIDRIMRILRFMDLIYLDIHPSPILTRTPTIISPEDPMDEFDRALREGRLNDVHRLLQDPQVDPTLDDNEVLSIASGEGYLDILNLLLQDPQIIATLPVGLNSALEVAASSGHVNTVNRLLQYSEIERASVNKALRDAARYGHVNVVDRLLQDPRANPAANHNRALIIAAGNGYLNIVNRLIQDERVNPSALDNAAIKAAIRNNHTDVVNRLLQDERVSSTFESTQ